MLIKNIIAVSGIKTTKPGNIIFNID